MHSTVLRSPCLRNFQGDYIAAGASSSESAGSGKSAHGSVFLWTLRTLPDADGFSESWQTDGTLAPVVELDSFDAFGAAIHM